LLNVFDCPFRNYRAISGLAFLMGLRMISPLKKTSGASFPNNGETAPRTFKN
jgi:hypothetical protein